MGPSKSIHLYTRLTVAFAAFVIFAGAMVTSTGSGMAVPDWPQSFGTWTPKMSGGVFYEHGHRVVAGALACLVLALAAWAAAAEPRGRARLLTWAALVAVIAQALLGGLTVLMGTYYGWDHTSPWVSAAHASLAQALFAVLVAYATVSAPGWQTAAPAAPTRGLRLASAALVLLLFIQIVLGAVMRHQHAGGIIEGFPLSNGSLVPDFFAWQVGLNFAHRVGAWLVAGLGVGLALRVLRDGRFGAWTRGPAWALLAAVLGQFLLGAGVVWTHLALPLVRSAHVVGGSVLFACAMVLALRLRRVRVGA